MDNKTIQSFWYSTNCTQNSISPIELLCIASYLHHHHEFHLYTYTPNDASMTFIQEQFKNHQFFFNLHIKDAREILDEEKIFFDNRGKVGIAAFSDLFRFQLLYTKGGWWVDMDTICMQPLHLDQPYVFASERIKEKWKRIQSATCIIKAQKDSVFLHNLIQTAHEIIKQDLESVKRTQNTWLFKLKLLFNPKLSHCINKNNWGIIGPWFLQKTLHENQEMQQYIVPANYFCEINYWEAHKFLQPNLNLDPIKQNIYALHLWNAMWEDHRMDKNYYPPNSLLYHLKELYLPAL